MISYLNAIDTKVFLYLNSLHNSFFDPIMWQVSHLYIWVPLFIGILAHIIYHERKYSWLPILCIILAIILADQISSTIIKHAVERLRPTHNPAIEQLVHTLNGYRGGQFGFVSSHAANGFTLAVFTSLLIKHRWFSFVIFGYAIIVAYSRIYLGVHYPGDILGGALVGSACGLLMFWINSKVKLKIIGK